MSFKSQPQILKQSTHDNLLLPQSMRSASSVSTLDKVETVAANPKEKSTQPACLTDPLSWMCYYDGGKCICPMRGDLGPFSHQN